MHTPEAKVCHMVSWFNHGYTNLNGMCWVGQQTSSDFGVETSHVKSPVASWQGWPVYEANCLTQAANRGEQQPTHSFAMLPIHLQCSFSSPLPS